LFKRYKKKFDKMKQALVYPVGSDEKFDDECDRSFDRFFDKLVYVAWIVFFMFGSTSVYFFIREVII